MKRSISLYAHGQLISSPFGLIGDDENALTFALGYTLQQCVPLLQWFLKQVGVTGVHSSALKAVRIDLQRYRSGEKAQGITDIEIHLPGHFHLIVEAKVGLAVPTIQQCQKYLPRFTSTNEPIQKLVAIVQSLDQTFVATYQALDGRFPTDWSASNGLSYSRLASS